ncbi:MAG: hypothetical protein K0V04_31990 [Deltaproteobacteria bacterium]|nr:hypothetical protein [Deltaproteobacteria bacterium]
MNAMSSILDERTAGRPALTVARLAPGCMPAARPQRCIVDVHHGRGPLRLANALWAAAGGTAPSPTEGDRRGVIDRLVDARSAPDPAVAGAYHQVRRALRRLDRSRGSRPWQVVVVGPRGRWRRGDRATLDALMVGAQRTMASVLVACRGEPPPGWALRWTSLGAEEVVPSPARPQPEDREGPDAWLGDDDIEGTLARLTAKEHAAASGVPRWTARARRDGYCVAQRRFTEVDTSAAVPATLPPPLRGVLLRQRGWALALMRRPEASEACLDQAERAAPLPSEDPVALYLANLRALNRLHAGDPRGALSLEHALWTRLNRLERPPAPLVGLAAINTSRLYEVLGDPAAAEQWLDTGLATADGCLPETLAVLGNVQRARLRQRQGDAQGALLHLLRATLHWTASAVPEAVPSRLVAVLTGKPGDHWRTDPERVSTVLHDRLLETAARAGLGRIEAPAAPPTIARISHLPAAARRTARVLLAPGWSVVTLRERVAPAYDGPAFAQLRGAVASVLHARCQRLGVASAPTVLLEDTGHEFPGTLDGAFTSVLRHRLTRLDTPDRSLCFDADARARALASARVRRGPAVAAVHGRHAYFTRFLPPVALTRPELDTLRELGGAHARASRLLALDGVTTTTLWAMERRRIIRIEASPS